MKLLLSIVQYTEYNFYSILQTQKVVARAHLFPAEAPRTYTPPCTTPWKNSFLLLLLLPTFLVFFCSCREFQEFVWSMNVHSLFH